MADARIIGTPALRLRQMGLDRWMAACNELLVLRSSDELARGGATRLIGARQVVQVELRSKFRWR
jgi:hypothetical protein